MSIPRNLSIIADTLNSDGTFASISNTGSTTLSGGTANGVTYLNGSKVLTTGSAFVFDGTSVGIGTSSPVVKLHVSTSGNTPIIGETTGGATSYFNLRNTGGQAYIAASTNDLLFALTSSATEGMRLTSTGLGIGTTSPAYKLTINDATGNYYPIALTSSNMGVAGNYVGMLFGFAGTTYQKAAVIFQSADGNARGTLNFCLNGAATSANATLSDSKVAIDYSGNVGIGTSSPAQKLQVAGKVILGAYANTGAYGLYLRSDAQSTHYNWQISTQNTVNGGFEIARSDAVGSSTFNSPSVVIDSSGNLLVGTTTGRTSKIVVEADGTTTYGVTSNMTAASGTRYHMIFRESGTERGSITSNGTVTVYNTTSDYRLKTVIGAVSGSGERIDALEPIEYTWNSNGQRTRGFLAHKFQEVYADSVTGTKDAVDADGNPKYQAMQAGTSEVIADLVAEIQSLRKRLTALESKEIS